MKRCIINGRKSRYRGRSFEFKGYLLKLYEFLSIPSWGVLIALNIGAGIGRRAAKGIPYLELHSSEEANFEIQTIISVS